MRSEADWKHQAIVREMATVKEIEDYAKKHGLGFSKAENIGMAEFEACDGYDDLPDVIQVADNHISLVWL